MSEWFEYSWDTPIEDVPEPEFTVLPEGDYDFTVLKVERSRTKEKPGSPACNMAILTLQAKAPDGQTVTVTDYLVLRSSLQWKLSQFFKAIGQMPEGAKNFRMNWGAVPGAHGRCHLYVDEWQPSNGGEKRKNNKVKSYLIYAGQPAAPGWGAGTPTPSQQGGWNAAPAQQQQGSWNAAPTAPTQPQPNGWGGGNW